MGVMGFLNDVLGSGPAPTLSDEDIQKANKIADNLVNASPEEKAYLQKIRSQLGSSDDAVVDEQQRLRARGDDLGNVDQAYMERAYKPAFERLMFDYGNMDQDIQENMNARGIASIPGGESEPENYQRRLLARDTKESLGRTMLEAQNQAVQQKLNTYNARMGEVNQANTRQGQVTGELHANRGERINAGSNIYNARLGLASQGYQMENKVGANALGGIMGIAGSMMASDPKVKKDIREGPDPEQDLQEMSNVDVDRWKYRWEGDETPEHEGAMMDEAPEDTQVPGGIDIPSYLGKLTNSVKALNNKVGAFERLMQTQGGTA